METAVATERPTAARTYVLLLVAAWVVLTLTIWVSSGSLTPLNLTSDRTYYDPHCGYIYNADHVIWLETFLMFDGADPSRWIHSVVLRRTLYPLLAYPLMKTLGFEIGGFVTNVLLQWATFIGFVLYLKHRFGKPASIAAMWLLAVYPGIAYWVGLPYGYAFIVPACLTIAILLLEIDRGRAAWHTLLLVLGIGVLFVGYDLLPIFGPATLLVLIGRRRFWLIVPATVCLLAPMALNLFLLSARYGVPLSNPNSDVYTVILTSYLGPYDVAGWLQLLQELPGFLLDNYLASNFLFVPSLFVALLLLSLATRRLGLSLVEVSMLAGVGLLWFFNNAAPPYEGYQMRGVGFPRLYQSAFVPMMLYAARWCQSVWSLPGAPGVRRLTIAALGLTLLGNAFVVYGPILGAPNVTLAYYRFYRHAPPSMQTENLERFARRPIGLCAPDFDRLQPTWAN